MSDTQKIIGSLIRDLRIQKGITQKELAEACFTTQSVIARMEKGDQNLTVETMAKISDALGKDIFRLSDGSLNIKIKGGNKLSGTVTTKSSKNAAVALLCASLLNKGVTTLKNMPRIEEVNRLIEVLTSIGVTVKWDKSDVIIAPPKVLSLNTIDKTAARRTRSIIMFIGPLLASMSDFALPQAGGCKLGSRTVRPHFYALEPLGVSIEATETDYEVTSKDLKPAEIILYETGDTVTENALMAAATIEGETIIKYASSNYMVQDLCHYLVALGVEIEGIGTTTLTVHGKKNINKNITFHVGGDPIESMFFLSAAIVTKSQITIERCPIEFLELELLKLTKMGFTYEASAPYVDTGGFQKLVDITTFPSELHALEDKIHSLPYPGLNADNLPFFAVIASQAHGTTFIHDWMYEKRAIYLLELEKLGADMLLADPHRLYVTGPTPLSSAEVICPPALRPGAIVLIGMLAAEGESILRNIYSINRGYEDIVKRLADLGADIELIRG